MTAGPEPLVAMAATPREWGQTLHRHLADHGGARLRATVLHPDDALAEDYDVLVADDATSFLTHRLVNELSRRGRAVLGVFDPDDPDGKERLRDLGVADVVERDAGPAEILERLTSLAAELPTARATATSEAPLPSPPQRSQRTGRLIAVTGVSGGVGTSEAAIALADLAGTLRAPAALLDADDRWATLAQRLGCGLYPNVVAGVDALAREHPDPTALLQPALAGRVGLLPGARRDAAEVAGEDLAELAEMAAESCEVAVVDAATADRHPAPPAGPGARPGPGPVLAQADDVVLVADASPAGAGRALDWLAANRVVAPSRLRVLFNRSDAEPFRRRELNAEIGRLVGIAGAWHAPTDPRVGRAAWDGAGVAAGPYRRAVATLLADLDSRWAPARRRLRPAWRRGGRGA